MLFLSERTQLVWQCENQMKVVATDVLHIQFDRDACRKFGEALDRMQIAFNRTLGIVTALEFLQHPFS
jgi:hypothetical protein